MKWLAMIHAVVIMIIVAMSLTNKTFYVMDSTGLSDFLIAATSAIVLVAILVMRKD